jgi:polyisoprenyl-teichoic acid--peptidoglycan teichoic acid transferase
MKRFKKLNKKFRILIIITISLIVLVSSLSLGSVLYLKSKMSKMQTVSIPKIPSELGINTQKFNDSSNSDKTSSSSGSSGNSANNDTVSSSDIKNILFLGIDSKALDSYEGRSDAILVLTIDKKHNKLKLTSILRDSLVSIAGHGKEKLTHAHAYGGSLLSLKTINQNYELNIMDYVQVDFFGFEKIVDYLGGVNIDISKNEIPVANKYIEQLSKIENKAPSYIKSPGTQTLNGIQTVGYARIRYDKNEDFGRTDRHRAILAALFKKASSLSPTQIPGMLDVVMPYIETSMKSGDIINDATYVLLHGMTTLEQQRVPYDGLCSGSTVNGMSVELWDKEPTIEKLHKFIFEN